MMVKTTLNPEGLPVPRGSYSVVTIAQPGRMVFIAGQTASDSQGNVIGVGDARAQTRYIIEKIKKAIEAAGGTLDDVVAIMRCTTNPARVIGWQDRIGGLEVGREADIAVLQIVNEPTKLRDSVGGEMMAEQRIAARWTIRQGEVFEGAG